MFRYIAGYEQHTCGRVPSGEKHKEITHSSGKFFFVLVVNKIIARCAVQIRSFHTVLNVLLRQEFPDVK
jgi:hypothetical protein